MSEKEEKFDIKHTFLIGLAFFSSSIAWDMYDSQVSISLYAYLAGLGLTGLLLGLDNLVGVIVQPIMGNVSDNTRTKLGRRIPYLIIGVPLGAIFFILISFETSLASLLIYMFCFIFSMAFWRSQAVSLMPDFVKPEHRSKGNAIINMMGGLGTVAAAIIGIIFVDVSLQLSFIIVAIIMIISLVVLVLTVKEKESFSYKNIIELEQEIGKKVTGKKKEKVGLIDSLKDIWNEEDKSTLFALLGILFLMTGYYGLKGMFTIYGTEVMGFSRGEAQGYLLYTALTFMIVALPLSILAEKFGRRLLIRIGLIIFTIGTLIAQFFSSPTMLIVCLIIVGIGYACVVVNTIVIIWAMAPSAEKIGTYTGVYYAFSYTSAIIGPGLVELLCIALGWNSFFFVCSIFLIVAFIFMMLVKREQAELTEEQKLAKKKAIQEI